MIELDQVKKESTNNVCFNSGERERECIAHKARNFWTPSPMVAAPIVLFNQGALHAITPYLTTVNIDQYSLFGYLIDLSINLMQDLLQFVDVTCRDRFGGAHFIDR